MKRLKPLFTNKN